MLVISCEETFFLKKKKVNVFLKNTLMLCQVLLIIWKNTMGLKIFLQNCFPLLLLFGQYTLIKIEKEALLKSGGNSTKIY